jgi:hypothetical protein
MAILKQDPRALQLARFDQFLCLRALTLSQRYGLALTVHFFCEFDEISHWIRAWGEHED